MRIGIDIGGTHTDGVLMDGPRLVAAAKAPTNHNNLLESISQVLHTILAGQDAQNLKTLNLSTTLTTNAIVTGQTDPVATLVVAGPGLAPEHYRVGDHFHVLSGSLDHRGTETSPLNEEELAEVIAQCCAEEVTCFAVAAKFSPRNPIHEETICKQLDGKADFISSGHLISGQLNFGRRIHTAYYNSSVWRTFRNFASALIASLKGCSFQGEINILKADGGTMPLTRALETPVESIFSGPAASVMGILANAGAEQDLLMLDIGGTTSDIALFASGQPLLEREGIAIDGRPTLVRAIRVESIGIGGDSAINISKSGVQTGPQRLGPCLAQGGKQPALMDALNVLGQSFYGEVEQSIQGMEQLAAQHDMPVKQLARDAIDSAVNAISSKIESLVAQVNSRPVYTIHEILEDREITPKKLIVIGGPAAVFQQLLSTRLGLKVEVPPLHGVANAIGAALTRTTSHISLSADTSRGKVLIPQLDINRSISRSYNLDEAIAEAKEVLRTDLEKSGVSLDNTAIQITQADSFNMVEGSYTAGKNIRVVAQVQPAVMCQLDNSGSTVSVTTVS